VAEDPAQNQRTVLYPMIGFTAMKSNSCYDNLLQNYDWHQLRRLQSACGRGLNSWQDILCAVLGSEHF